MRLAVASLLLACLPATAAELPEACHSTVDDPPPTNGPSQHRVAQAVSTDGVTFAPAGPELAKASVPDAVERGDGQTWVYYVSGEAGRHGINIGRVTAGGAIEPFDCVRLDGAYDGHAVDPDVVRLADGRYRLFYKANFGLEEPGEPSIESAVSTDGIQFTREGVALDNPGGVDPSVVLLPNGEWLMSVPGPGMATLARSSDGQSFTVERTVPLDGIPELWVKGTQVHLLGGATQLRQLTSDDNGVTWGEGQQLTVNLPAEGGLGSPSVSGHAGAWRLLVVKVNNIGAPGQSVCQPSPTTLCLGQGRFRATANWSNGNGGPGGNGSQGLGNARPLGRDSGTFWFFHQDNTELLVKVLDGCAVNDAYWVFAAGLTNLAVELRVEDTWTDQVWTHHGTLGTTFPSATDVSAFNSCDATP